MKINRIDVITIFPGMLRAITDYGVNRHIIEKQLIKLQTWNPRDYAMDNQRTVDDRPFGGGPGMVMKYQPLKAAIDAAKAADQDDCKTIFLSPQGNRLDHQKIMLLSKTPRLILIAGRYEGIDERLLEKEVDEEYSIGDYVLTGGELAAMVFIDAIIRLLPGALGDNNSAKEDSFFNGLLDYPHYTRPEVVDGLEVPEILLSGNHKAIQRWRLQESLGRTWLKRNDLLEKLNLTKEQSMLLNAFQKNMAKEPNK